MKALVIDAPRSCHPARYLADFQTFFDVRRVPDRSAKKYRLATPSQATAATI